MSNGKDPRVSRGGLDALVGKLPAAAPAELSARLQAQPAPPSVAATFRVTQPQRVTAKLASTVKLAPITPAAAPVPPTPAGEEPRPNSAHGRTVLPGIAPKTNGHHAVAGPTSPTALALELPPNVDEINDGGPLAIAEFVRAQGEARFFYLAENRSSAAGTHGGTSSIRIVAHAQTDPKDYMTISAAGVTHVTLARAEFTPLDRWVQEHTRIFQLLDKKTFSNFRLWKAFAVWRKAVIHTKRKERTEALQATMFLLDPLLRPTLLHVRAKCLGLVNMRLCVIDRSTTYTLQSFLEAQSAQLKLVAEQLSGFCDGVRAAVLAACKQALATAGFSEGHDTITDGEAAEPRAVPGLHKASYTAQATKRNLCARLTAFVRLVDALVANSMHSLASESVQFLFDTLRSLDLVVDTGGELDATEAARRHSLITVDGAAVVLRRPTLGKKQLQPFSSKADETQPLFKVELHLDPAQIAVAPTESDFRSALRHLVAQFQNAAIGVPTLLPDAVFAPFTQPIISGRAEPASFSESVSLSVIFEDDHNLHELTAAIDGRLERAFRAVHSFTVTLDPFRVMLATNQALDEKWLTSTDHSPEYFRESLHTYKQQFTDVCAITPAVEVGMTLIDCAKLKEVLMPSPKHCLQMVQGLLPVRAAQKTRHVMKTMDDVVSHLQASPSNTLEYVKMLTFLGGIEPQMQEIEAEVRCVGELYDLVEQFQVDSTPEDHAEYQNMKSAIIQVRDVVKKAVEEMPKKVELFCDELDKDISALGASVLAVRTDAHAEKVFKQTDDVHGMLAYMDDLNNKMNEFQERAAQYKAFQKQFKVEVTKFSALEETHVEIRARKAMWESVRDWSTLTAAWQAQPFLTLDADDLSTQVTKIFKQVFSLSKTLPPNEVLPGLQLKIDKMKAKIPTIVDLRNPALKPRHWERINTTLGQEIPHDDTFTLTLLDELNAWAHAEALQEISGAASSEAALETMLKKVEDSWKSAEFPCLPFRESKDVFILGGVDDVQVLLDDSLVNMATISGSRHVGPIKTRVEDMQRQLNLFAETLEEWLTCQRSWLYLESIFSAPDIQRQLPAEAKMFLEVDKSFKEAMRRTAAFPNALRAGCTPGFLEMFKKNNVLLEQIQRCLEDYLESKRMVFARFYFLSNDELLEILSQTRNPLAVQPHMRKCFDAIQKLDFGDTKGGNAANDILAMISPEGERIALGKGLKARGNVEVWLGAVEDSMIKSLRALTKTAIGDYQARPRTEWVRLHASQVVLTVSQIFWCRDIVQALTSADPAAALQAFERKCQSQLADLAAVSREKIPGLFRKVLGALITIDVHARDIVTGMVAANVKSIEDFEWSKQLRYYWEEAIDDCAAYMSNSRYIYAHEYLGASPRLVITPLTDRCYLCLMGALQLDLGGAPAGPAGTGKTETTKDLAKALGTQCVVFNCSEGLDFRMMGKFFAGLAQSGAWCCFDEFNRIDIEVLSVIAQQILTIRNAKTAKATRFMFEGREIGLIPTCAVFITMNPGYAGRTELPDNLKALFRPFAMMVPDYGLIAEVILFSEGFEDPKNLARKMVQMYKLCSEQLSLQDHYDFGMRAVKSVLVMAGQLKRERADQNEAAVLLTALRDSNLPKFLADDAILFQAILSDLFPGIEPPKYDYGRMQTAIEGALSAMSLEVEAAQVKKVIQLYETMVVRHGVMLVGPTGGGKTTVYRALAGALTQLHKDKVPHPDYQPVQTYVMNPKAITMGELYGEVNKTTLEWRDGLMALTVRHCVAEQNDEHKWVICDGPVDALWIENMNTVLDDNKMLCLANSERIKLTPSMHMVFEVQDLRVASPATVSRCGMVYIDPTELGWRPFVTRWIKTLPKLQAASKEKLTALFDAHVGPILHEIRKKMTQAIAQTDGAKMAAFCNLLQELLVGTDAKFDWSGDAEQLNVVVANLFFFALVWSLGGNLVDSDQEKFDALVRDAFNEVREVRLPGTGTVFDFYYNAALATPAFEMWEKIVPAFSYDPAVPFFDMLVPTTGTIKYSYLLEKHLLANYSVLFTGTTGVGKSVVARSCLKAMAESRGFVPVTINFSAQTSSIRTQEMIESKLEKKRKNILGAPEDKRIILLVDDLNMPRLDTYGAQPPIELLRQYQDFGGFYDREKLFWKEIKDVTLAAACAPPGGGRNPVTPRLMRHFAMFCLPPPDERSLKVIFSQIVDGFTSKCEFSKPVQKAGSGVVAASVEIYQRMSAELLPTPAKSHYVFNLRDLSKCVQGVLQADPGNIREADQMWELFCHESMRVFHDRLISAQDKLYYCGVLAEMSSKYFSKSVEPDTFVNTPILFGDFSKIGAPAQDRIYERLDLAKVGNTLVQYLDDYNLSSSKEMSLVFFMDAIQHVTRVARMMRQPRGNALLVGVGGTGKQSLTRMASHMCGYKCIQIEITRGYGTTEFREDLKKLYESAGSKGQDTVFLFTDTQIVVEEFLEDINNMLNSGEVPNLFESDEIEKYLQPVRPLAKAAGYPETRDGVFQFFINRVRDKLHIVLCMSPVGDAFRSRCRMFPSIVNCCTIDWFTEWPHEALLSVAKRFFEFVDLGGEHLKPKVSEMCVEIHTSVSKMADRFYNELRRKYYTTPTSYLELINLYSSMLDEKRRELVLARDRFKSGLSKLMETNGLVEKMQTELTALAPILQQRSADTSRLMEKLKVDQAEADRVRRVVKEEEAIAKASANETDAIRQDAQRDLDQALPALAAANKALDSLDKKDVQVVKVFNTPPELVQVVMEAVCTLFGRKADWKTAKQLLGESDFLNRMVSYDKDNIPEATLKKLKPYIDDPRFQPEAVSKVSTACTSMCLWVRAIDMYAHIFREVTPKREKLAAAEASLQKTMAALKEKQDQLNAVEMKIAELKRSFDESVRSKEELEQNMALTAARLQRASKLQAALGDEQVRWSEAVVQYDVQVGNVVGNVFIAAACVAYFGAFTASYRQELVQSWIAKCRELEIPVSDGLSIANVLSTPYQIRQWNTFGLPRDSLSTENAILVSCGRRWPLMIDPQDQANTWIRNMEARNGLQVIKLTEPNFLRTLENCIRTGAPVLLEEVGETLDPSLEPVLLKQTFKQGGRLLIRLGDSDVDYDKNFRFYLTTKMANPHYLPEICIKVTIINFTVTKTGLEDQLLSDVVRLERPDLEQQRTKLIVAINEDKGQLKAIEDKILRLLFNSKGNILDDEDLIATLNDSKVTSTAIGVRLAEAERTEASITEAREKYRPAAIRGSVMFFVIADMANIDPMYQYSLGYFKQLFVDCISRSEPSPDLPTRLQNICDYSTLTVYTSVARGLFEKHKLVFSFMLCAEILRQRGDIADAEWNFFLRGARLDEKKAPARPSHPWLTDERWHAVVLLEQALPQAFAGFSVDVAAAPLALTIGRIAFSPNPATWEGCGTAGAVDWNSKLTSFQKLIVMKQIAEERVNETVVEFVTVQLGPRFVESPTIELATLYKDISPAVPLVFILSVGSDPMTAFLRFAREMNYADRVHSISLGQGQGPVAERLIAQALKTGDWVFLQNCHLAKSWMFNMEGLIKSLSAPGSVVHDDFRLFLSSAPCDFFPVSVLQNSVKVTNEPPKGIRANLRRAFQSIQPETFEHHHMGLSWRKLVFGLSFFHGIVQERTKYGALGWNIRYEFSNSDRECALETLKLFLEDGKVPWDALSFITGEITYGGRVTDFWDQRCLRAVLRRFFNPQSIEPGYKYSPSGVYFAPDLPTWRDYVSYIEALPFTDNPEIFGMHDNANIAFLREETSALRNAVLDVQPRLVTSGGQRSPDEIVFETAEQILATLPKAPLDLETGQAHLFVPDAKGRVPSLSTVLKQEIDRFNNLLRVLWRSLADLQKAIRGFVVMSAELEKIYNSFLNNQVPKMWETAAYPSLKPLGSWVTDLVLRIEFVRSWLTQAQPPSFWLSGFFFPQGFITGVLQTYARKYNAPIDTLGFKFHVLPQYYDQTAPAESRPELPAVADGVLVHGLFMDAFRWDDDAQVVTDSRPGVMRAPLPVMHMEPAAHVKSESGRYTSPLYKTSVRAGVLSTTGHSTNFVIAVHLPSSQSEDYWIAKGAALLCQLDV